MQLVHALQHGLQVIHLRRRYRSGQSIDQQRDVLVDAGKRRSQFVRDVGEELVLELQLLLARGFEGAQQALPFDSVMQGALQLLAGDLAFDEIVLHPQVHGFDGEILVLLPGEYDHRNSWGFLHNAPEGFRSMTVRQVQIE
jgi:hypothetical protein